MTRFSKLNFSPYSILRDNGRHGLVTRWRAAGVNLLPIFFFNKYNWRGPWALRGRNDVIVKHDVDLLANYLSFGRADAVWRRIVGLGVACVNMMVDVIS